MLLKMPDRVVVFRAGGFFGSLAEKRRGPAAGELRAAARRRGARVHRPAVLARRRQRPGRPRLRLCPNLLNAVQQVRRNDHVDS